MGARSALPRSATLHSKMRTMNIAFIATCAIIMLFAVATIEAKLDEDAVVPEAQLSVASAAKRKKPCLTAKQIKAVKHLISQGITAAKVKAETKRMHKEEAAYAYQKPEYEAADKKLKRMMKKEKDIVIKEKDHKFLKGHGKLPKTQELGHGSQEALPHKRTG